MLHNSWVYEAHLFKASGWTSTSGPECVKTLSYRGCLSPAQLGESIAHAFATISTGNAPERLLSVLAPPRAAKAGGFYAAIAFNKPSAPMILMTRFML